MIIADKRSAGVVANVAATVACAFDIDFIFHPMLAQRALSDGVASTPLDVARSAWECWEYPVNFGA